MHSRAPRIYLDHNATSPLRIEARRAMSERLASRQGWGNPSSPHAEGHQARLLLESARGRIATALGAAAREIVFVSGGTEADNSAILSAARGRLARGDGPGHLIASAVEHPAVLGACRLLESEGWELTLLPVDADGRVDPGDARRCLRPDTGLMTIMTANNETGVIQPVPELADVAREAGVPLHTDAVQAIGRMPLNPGLRRAAMASCSSHKLGGPAGIGALIVREGTAFLALLQGGGQEERRRPGTQAVMLAEGFAAALAAAGSDEELGRIARLRDRLEGDLRDRIEGLKVNGQRAPRLPGTSSLTIPGCDAEALVIRMDLEGIAISTGSACSTGSSRPSHVLRAMGLGPELAASTVRVSLGPGTTDEEIDRAARTLCAAVEQVRRAGVAAREVAP